MLSLLAHTDDALYGSINFPEVSINWLAVLVAVAITAVIGYLWYGPILGKKWLKLVKLNKKDLDKDWRLPMGVMLAMAFLQALIIKHIVVYTAYFYPETSNLSVGLLTGFWLFAGIALPIVLTTNLFARRPLHLSYIDAGYQLVTIGAVSTILAVWI